MMFNEPKQEKIPGYYTQFEYDAMRTAAFKWEQEYKQLKAEADAEIARLQKDLSAALFFKADAIKQDEGEIVISDPKLRSDMAFILHSKGKPGIVIKYRGSTAVEIRQKS